MLLSRAVLLLGMVAAFFSGCAALDSTNSGQIAGSVGLQMTTSDSHFKGVGLGYRSEDGRERGGIHYFPDLVGGALAQIKEGEYHGTTFLKTLRAGRYHFVLPTASRTVLLEYGLIEAFRAKETPIFTFTVVPGEVTYVGSWEATPVTRDRLLGPDRMIGYTFSMSNREARDLALIHGKGGGGNSPLKANSSAGLDRRASKTMPGRAVRVDSGTEYLAR